jgi:membrane associated rhomboid family serine protease
MSSSRLPRWLQTFVPTKEIKVTPVIISVNVLMYFIMVLNGVHPLTPQSNDLLAWGASSASEIGDGEYWRLFTSNYLHYGLVHLAVNMLSLNNLGRMLEQFIGSWRIAVIYTLAGIFACAVSIWWNPYPVGAGASGAILGVAGILLALLTTNLIEKTARFRMLRSMMISVAMMVLIGFIPNVDNAAHIAGAAAGMLGGYFIYPELRAHFYERKKQYTGLIAFVLVMAGGSGWFVTHVKDFNGRTPEQITSDLNTRRAIAEKNFAAGQYTTAEAVEENMVTLYADGLLKVDSIQEMTGNPESAAYYAKVKQHLSARQAYFVYVAKDMRSPGNYADSADYWRRQSDSLQALVR